MDDKLIQDFQKREKQRQMKKAKIIAIPILILVAVIILIIFINQPKPTCFDAKQNGNEAGIDCGGNCVACGIKYAEALRIISDGSISDGQMLAINNNLSEAIAKIQNVNADYGAKFDYEMVFYNQIGEELGKISNQSYIFPASSKYLIEPKVNFKSSDVSKIKVSFSNLNWFFTDKTAQDIFSIFDKKAVVLSASQTGYLEVSGKIANKTSHDFSRVNMQILIYSKTGRLLHATKTTISDVLANENGREFSYIGFPYFFGFSEIDLNRVEIIADALIE